MATWAPLRELLDTVEDSKTIAWDELDAIVGGLPRSAYVHSAFWSGERAGWRGFRATSVAVGESVTFVRAGARVTVIQDASPEDHGDVVLVGCVKKKLTVPSPAQDLYVSALFRKQRSYAERLGVPWFILSAEHGLVRPEQILEPYDLQLSKTSSDYRKEWGERVVRQLHEAAGVSAGTVVEIHAGAAYANAIRPLLAAQGVSVLEPLAGRPLGARLAWYRSTTRHVESGSPPADPGVHQLVDGLRRGQDAIAPSTFLLDASESMRSPGLYSWWVDPAGAADLSKGLGHPVAPGIIYAGLAGATRARSGRKSKNTLWGRIKTMHLGGRHEFSTFRLSLGSILAEASGRIDIDEPRLTAWMHEHLRLVALPVADADTLGSVETDVLAALDPPLNLDKVPRTQLRRRLSELRKVHRRTT